MSTNEQQGRLSVAPEHDLVSEETTQHVLLESIQAPWA